MTVRLFRLLVFEGAGLHIVTCVCLSELAYIKTTLLHLLYDLSFFFTLLIVSVLHSWQLQLRKLNILQIVLKHCMAWGLKVSLANAVSVSVSPTLPIFTALHFPLQNPHKNLLVIPGPWRTPNDLVNKGSSHTSSYPWKPYNGLNHSLRANICMQYRIVC